MRRTLQHITWACLLTGTASCGVSRYLPPGEKLYEDLFSESEEMKETHHEKIMISKEAIHNIAEAETIISKLQALENFYEPELFRMVIKELLPEYQSVTADGKVVNFRSGKRINQYNYQN